MSEPIEEGKSILVVSPEGQTAWTDPKVGTNEKYIEDGYRVATDIEIEQAAANLGKSVEEMIEEVQAEMYPAEDSEDDDEDEDDEEVV